PPTGGVGEPAGVRGGPAPATRAARAAAAQGRSAGGSAGTDGRARGVFRGCLAPDPALRPRKASTPRPDPGASDRGGVRRDHRGATRARGGSGPIRQLRPATFGRRLSVRRRPPRAPRRGAGGGRRKGTGAGWG